MKPDILYCDNHVLAAVKPANMPVQADASGDMDMLTWLKGWVKETYHKPGNVFLGLVHRLDRPVGGAMVFARTSKAASRLSQEFSAHGTKKIYLAVARGEIEGERRLTHYLRKGEDGMVRCVPPDAPGAKEARLVSRSLCAKDGLTLLAVELLTGRSHQIRVQHAAIGHPLWGDARYGQGRPGEQIALWAASLTVTHPTQRTEMTFCSPPPRSGVWQTFGEEIDGQDWLWKDRRGVL